MANKRNKPNKSKFIFPKNGFTIDHRVLNHPDYINLPPVSKILLFDMFTLYNGFNNGNISIALSVMEHKGWTDGKLDRGKKPLLKADWIRLTRVGEGKFRACHLYAFSWIPLDECKDKLEIKIKDFVVRGDMKTM